jgi:ribonuclease HI
MQFGVNLSMEIVLCGSACREGQGIEVFLISRRGAIFETSARLKYFCTNNQADYEAILLGLHILSSMGVKHVKAFCDSLLVVQSVVSVYKCFNESLNAYFDKCLKIIALFDDFTMKHVSRDENIVVNDLTKQASGFQSNQGNFGVLEKPDISICLTGCSGF